jgi:hypothetical protein
MLQSINPGVSNDADGISLDESLYRIADELNNGIEGLQRLDTFKETFEKYFAVDIETIDNLEDTIVDDTTLATYDIWIESMCKSFDNYFGITFDTESSNVDLSLMYISYSIFYKEFIYYMAKYITGCLSVAYANEAATFVTEASKKQEDIYEVIVAPYIESEDTFEFETFIDNILVADPGNADAERIRLLSSSNVINVNNGAFRKRIKFESTMGENQHEIVRLVNKFVKENDTDEQS